MLHEDKDYGDHYAYEADLHESNAVRMVVRLDQVSITELVYVKHKGKVQFVEQV